MNTDHITGSDNASDCAACRAASCPMSETDRKRSPAPRAWYFCLALILLLYVLLFLFRSHIPEPWTALIAVALLIVYRVLRYWLHPPVKRNRLLSSES
jgi:membrane protein YdbS with pleckstrin-like domain